MFHNAIEIAWIKRKCQTSSLHPWSEHAHTRAQTNGTFDGLLPVCGPKSFQAVSVHFIIYDLILCCTVVWFNELWDIATAERKTTKGPCSLWIGHTNMKIYWISRRKKKEKKPAKVQHALFMQKLIPMQAATDLLIATYRDCLSVVFCFILLCREKNCFSKTASTFRALIAISIEF